MHKLGFLRPFGALTSIVVAFGLSGGCAENFDTERKPTPKLTLGDDLYMVLCDRVAATSDPADLEGRRSRGVCHADSTGAYRDAYDAADGDMPPKVAVMVRYRKDLIATFNALFPDRDSLQDDLNDLLKALVPLYDDDTVPESTRTLAAIFDGIAFDKAVGPAGESPAEATARKARAARAEEARKALARLGGRKGYRPVATAVGVARPVLAYERMADVTDKSIKLLGPGGPAEPQLRKVLEVAQAELASTVVPSARTAIPKYGDRFSGVMGQKPKITSEILRNLLLDPPPLKGDLSGPAFPATWADAFAAGAPTLPVLLRDAHGYASFATPPKDLDTDGDKLPVVNDFGQFVSKGKPLGLPTPFALATMAGSADGAPRDALGRALTAAGGTPLYRYGDASRTFLHTVLLDTRVLADTGTLLDVGHALATLSGPRSTSDGSEKDIASYADPDDPSGKIEVRYRKYDGAVSPLVDLVHAFGSFLQYPKTADYLELSRQLTRDHPSELARVIGAIMKVRDLANKPEYAAVGLDAKSALWDDVMTVVVKIAAEPDLLRDVLNGIADDDVLVMSKAMSTFAADKDDIDYDPAADTCSPAGTCPAINQPWYNVTKGGSMTPASTSTDLSKPDDEGNRSLFQRFLSLIHDAVGVRACNKDGAKIATKPVGLPLVGTYKECEVLDVPDLALFYVGCIAGGNDEITGKPRCTLPVTDTLVSALKSIGLGGLLDSVLESSSGITGLKQSPTIEALNRLVMWRSPNDFLTKLTDPIPTAACPITNPTTGHRTCASSADLMYNRQRATIFMGEMLDALKGLRPMVRPFVIRRGPDKSTRTQYFLDLVNVFHSYWSQGANAKRCTKGAAATDPKYCTGANVRQYERLMSEAIAGDLIPALNALQKVVAKLNIRGQTGTDVMVAMVADLVSPTNAKGLGLKTHKGSVGTTMNDGRPVPQVTPFYLFADALASMDKQWADSAGSPSPDHTAWRAARSKLVDQFVGVEAPGGDFSKSRMRNAGVQASMPILIDVLEDRLEEHKAKGDLATWATKTLPTDLETSVSGPLFAAAMDLQDAVWKDEGARSELGKLLAYLADQASKNDALASTITATQDLLQVIGDDVNMVPIYHAFATAAAPDGAAKRSLDLIDKVGRIETSAEWQAAHGGRRVIPRILANAVTPLGPGQPTPIEVLMDCITDLHRATPDATTDPSAYKGEPFAPVDYGSVARNVEEFLVDPTRGMEQFYAIVKKRDD